MRRDWKAILRDVPVVPDLILPLDYHVKSMREVARRFGMRVVIRKRPDGWHVWRVA